MAGGLSLFARNGLLGLLVGGTAFSRPGTVHLEPYETNPAEDGTGGDVPDNGYSARVAVTNNSTNFPAAAAAAKSLAPATILYTATGVETIVGVGLWDASSGGNFLALFEPGAGLATANGKRVKIPAGTLTLSLSGAWETALENQILDHLLGGGDYTPQASLHIGLISSGTTELSGNGYARVSKTNNTTNFSTPSGGAVSNATEIEFGPATGGNWVQANRVGIYTLSSGGSLIAVADLAAPVTVLQGETATFDVGELDFTLATDI